jgi:ferredoxin
MKQKHLKITRVVISLIFLLAITVAFLDFRHSLEKNYFNTVLYLQFIPSIVKFINVFTITVAGFIVVLLLTALAGRVYCSTICPLGIFQDIVSRIANKFKSKKKRKYKFSKPFNILRYSLLGLTIVSFMFGSIYVVNLLDPYSNYGRIATGFFKPLLIGINNLVAKGLENFDIYTIYPVDIKWMKLSALAFPILLFSTVVGMSAKNGRIYCNTICPVGTLLGYLSKFSFYKIKFNEESCINCGKCAVVCKSNCIDIKNKYVDFTRCVDCYNCLQICPTFGISYQTGKKKEEPVKEPAMVQTSAGKTDIGKRTFLATSLAYIGAGLTLSSRKVYSREDVVVKNPTTIPVEKDYPVSPPGSQSIRHMKKNCTACHACVSACPTGVLQPSFLEYGFTGMMQPYMDYHSNYCNFECTLCTDICPTGALLPVSEEEKKTLQLGKVFFEIDNCVVHTEKTACGSCSEHCPTQAVYMVPYEGALTIPEINPDICVGCGACEYACPTRPYRAIYVDGNPEHLVAEKPKSEKLEDVDPEEDFPF